MVTNGEFYEFVAQGGYFKREHWTEEGWTWRSFRNTRHPTFWVREG
jgi:formylglycine-generating enzyme required for sulfatase activity